MISILQFVGLFHQNVYIYTLVRHLHIHCCEWLSRYSRRLRITYVLDISEQHPLIVPIVSAENEQLIISVTASLILLVDIRFRYE